MSQSDTENDKNPQIFQFSKILGIFPVFRRTLLLNVEKSQQGKKVLSSRLFWCVNFSFQITTDKSPQIIQFSKILCNLFQIFDRLCELEHWIRSTKKECVVQ